MYSVSKTMAPNKYSKKKKKRKERKKKKKKKAKLQKKSHILVDLGQLIER